MVNILKNALMITGFVFVMMLVIEYFNVITSGVWKRRLSENRWGQYLLAAMLGIIPGCLGSFTAVTMCSHKMLTIGAVITTMIVTSGDGSFVMLAMIPKQAVLMWTGMLFIGIFAGVFTDSLLSKYFSGIPFTCEGLEIHEEERLSGYSKVEILRQWKECSLARGVLVGVLMFFVIAVISGQFIHHGYIHEGETRIQLHIEQLPEHNTKHSDTDQTEQYPETSAEHHDEHNQWNWVQVTLLIVSFTALFIVSTVPDHFLEDHFWKHVFIKHIPQVFLWTFGAILVIHILTEYLYLEHAIMQSRWLILLIACLMGLIPESGPHFVFVMLYVQGAIPISILLASSIVQDGHGMLPMLAASRRMFFIIKAINLMVGLLVGGIALTLGL